jgi:cytochrome c peroxidase
MSDLESQVRKSILTTLHGRKPTDQQVTDLAAYLRTLSPAPARTRVSEQVGHVCNVPPRIEAAIRRGRDIFHGQSCDRCHTPPQYTAKATYDVGLKDEMGNTRFNPPSLRGVSQAGPYFHDNRAATLEEVVTRYRHQLPNGLAREEVADLLAFLDSL